MGKLRRCIVALATIAVMQPAATSAASTPAKTAAKALRAIIGTRVVGAPVEPGFVGLSIEFTAIQAYTGTDPAAINPVLIQLIRNLSAGWSPVLRIGGDSTDRTWWPLRGVARPPGVDYRLTNGWMRTTRALADALDARLILGVNLEANDPAIAGAEAREYLSRLGRGPVAALEIGNEPDLYSASPWYSLPGGRDVFARPPAYSIASLIRQFSLWRRFLPSLPVTGPALAKPPWMNELGRFLSAEPGVRLVTIHRYPLSRCERDSRAPDYPTIANLLSDHSTGALARPLRRYVEVARAHGAELRVAEINSVSCEGRAGVSDTFASALWVLDTLFAFARQGVAGVNIHTLPGAAYELFTFMHNRRGWSAFVHPEYYGLELFARAAPAGSRLLAVRGSRGPLRIWATRDLSGTVRTVLINLSQRVRRRVYLTVPAVARLAPTASATIQWLRAPSVAATDGVTLGGQSFGDRTTSGRLRGTPREVRQRPSRRRLYVIDLPPATAALLTVP